MGEFDVKGGALKKLIKKARSQPLSFGFNPGNGPLDAYFGLHLRKPPKVVGKAAMDEGQGKKAAFGTVTVDGKLMLLTCQRELPAMAKKLKKYLISEKIRLNVQILGPDGSVIDSDIEENLPDDPELMVDEPADVPEPPEAVAAGSDVPDPAQGLALAKDRLKELGQQIQALDPTPRKSFAKPYGQLVELLKSKQLDKLEAGIGKVSKALEKLLDAAGQAAPEDAKEGTVSKQKPEQTSGKAILAELTAMGAELKAAVKILPERLQDLKDYVAEIQSAVSGNDLDLARVTLTKAEMLVAEASKVKQRAAQELAEITKLFEAAIEAGTGELDQLRAAFSFAQGKFQGEAYPAAFASFAKVRELARAAMAAGTSQAQDAAAAGAQMAETIKALENAEAVRAELAALKERLEAVLAFVSAKADTAENLYAEASAATHTGALDQAKRLVAEYAQIVAEGEFEKQVIVKRKQSLLGSMAKLVNPEGANDEEIASFDAQRRIVSEALAAEAPSPEDFGRATSALRQFDQLIEPARRRAELRAALAQVVAQHDEKKDEIDRLLALPGDTNLAVKLQRLLKFQSGQIGKLTGAEKLKPAQAMVKSLLATMAQMQAEEAEITKAAALKEQALREHKALKAQLDLARTIYEITPAFKADVEAFKEADLICGLRLKDKDYGRALGAIDVLKRAAARLTGRKAEFDTLAATRKTAIAKLRDMESLLAQSEQTPATKPEVAVLRARMKAAGSAIEPAAEANDWTAVNAGADEVLDLAQQIIDLKGACDALVADRAEALRRFIAVRDGTSAIRGRAGATPAFVERVQEIDDKLDDFVENYNNTRDIAKCLALAGELETLAADLATLDRADQAAIAQRALMRAEFAKVKDKLAQARAVKPYTSKMSGLYTDLMAAWAALLAVDKSAAADSMDVLNDAVAKADAVLAEQAENDKAKAAARQACIERVNAVEPDVDDALDLVRDNQPDLDDFGKQLNAKWFEYKALRKARRYLEATAVLDELAALSVQTTAAVAGAEAKMDAREAEYDGKYTSDFIDRIEAVLKFQDINDAIKDLKAQVDAVSDDCEDAARNDKYHVALEKFAALEPLLLELEGMKAEHDRLVADKSWTNTEWGKIKTDIDVAAAMKPVNREIADKIALYKSTRSACAGAYQAKKYSDARATFAGFAAAVADVVAKKAEHDSAVGKRDAVDAEFAKISSQYKKARDLRPLTAEIKKLYDAFREAGALFNKAYYSHDYDTALARVAALGKAADALVAKEADHAAADLAAKQKADETEAVLDAISADDLKQKSAEEQVALLDALRGQKKKLTPKQRELQIKVYMAMDLDPEFVKIDDARRDRLKDAIRDDEELQAARANWADTDPDTMIPPERKIALLTKTLKAECEIYGMPVPQVQTFSEPPGDLGSYNPTNNVININIHEEATFDDFFDTIDTIVHENAHNYQDYLVMQLEEGLIQPGDPEYNQALMFAANSGAYAYVTGSEDRACYNKQPLEEHAWKTGGDVQKALKAGPTV